VSTSLIANAMEPLIDVAKGAMGQGHLETKWNSLPKTDFEIARKFSFLDSKSELL
jgi:hypothetical protein